MTTTFLLLILIVFAANLVQTVTGFGAMVIMVTLGSFLFGIDYLVPLLVPLNFLYSFYILLRYRKHVDSKYLFRRIIPIAGAGLPIGIFLFHYLGVDWLKRAYGTFVFLYSAYMLLLLIMQKNDIRKPIGWVQTIGWLFSGGIVHGIYATGGPLMVIYLNRVVNDKTVFRSTLSGFFILLNATLCVSHAISGGLNMETIPKTGILLIPLAMGIYVGDLFHFRISQRIFNLLVNLVLIMAGAILAFG